jgi:hypothetical protein
MMRDGKRHQIGQAQANNPTARTGGKLQSIQKPYEEDFEICEGGAIC